MLCNVFRPIRMRNGKKIKARLYRGRYRLSSSDRIIDIPLNTADKRVAEKRLAEIYSNAELEQAGILPAKAIREAAQIKLETHLIDYISDFKIRNCNKDHIKRSEQRIKKLMTECNWIYPIDVTSDSFIRWRSQQTSKSPKTLNDYKSAIRAFLGWLADIGRITANPLSNGIKNLPTRGHQTYERRALTNDEIIRLLNVSDKRRIIYLTAVQTGLRRGELNQLLWSDVFLDADCPHIKLRADITKNSKDSVMPLKLELAQELRKHQDADYGNNFKLFSRGIPSRTTVKMDFEKAGIPMLDKDGRKADFHALRHTFITNVNQTGVAPRVAMEAARHSDQRLTDRVYTDTSRLPVSEAIEKLPSFISDDSHIDSQKVVSGGQTLAQLGTTDTAGDLTQYLEDKGFTHAVALRVASCLNAPNTGGGGNRTPVP